MGHAGVKLRLIDGGGGPRLAAKSAPAVANARAEERVPPPRAGWASARVTMAVAFSLAVHAAVIWWGMHWHAEQEARAEGGNGATEVIEGVSVILLDSMLSTPAPETLSEAVAVADASAVVAVADRSAVAMPDSIKVRAVADDIALSAQVADATGTVTKDAASVVDASSPVTPVGTTSMAAAPPDMPLSAEGDVSVAPVIEDPPGEARPAALVLAEARPVDHSDSAARVEAEVAVAAARPPAAASQVSAPAKPAKRSSLTKAKPVEKAAKPVPARPALVAERAAEGPRRGTAGAGGASREERGGADLSSYRAKLAAHIRRYRTYPTAARAEQLSGTARVTFTVDADGRVISVHLTAGSGHAVLDQEALAIVKRASPFPPIPDGAGQGSLTVTVPLRFELK